MAFDSISLYLKVYMLRWVTELAAWLGRRGGPQRPPGPTFTRLIPTTLSSTPGSFKLYFYYPSKKDESARPLVINFHGGGWCVGHARDDEHLIAALTARGAVVVSVNYRLAPEHTYPVALEDSLDALLYIWSNAETLGVDKHRTILAGSSAGGQLAFSSLLLLWERMQTMDLKIEMGTVKGIVTFYPSMDQSKNRAERASSNPALMELEKNKPAASAKIIGDIFDNAYYWKSNPPIDKRHMGLSPGLAPDRALKEALPEHINFQVAGLDYLWGEQQVAIKRLKDLGKQVTCEVTPDVLHYWDHMTTTEELKRLRDDVYDKASRDVERMWSI